MSIRQETRTILHCEWCGWEVNTRREITEQELRAKAAEQDGWRVIDGQDVCGQLHAREK